MGYSVTQRIKQIKQPRGGYINPKSLSVTRLGDGIEALSSAENVHPILIGLAVDYLTRFLSGAPVEDAFQISILGAGIVNELDIAYYLQKDIRGLDDASIVNALRLCGYDSCFRAGPMYYIPVDTICPNKVTIQNVRTMVQRSLYFLSVYGPKVLDGFTFEGGYTDLVCAGDGDFTTWDTIWDFKVSKLPVKKEYTLQLLMYWCMGLHSIHPEFRQIRYLGIYNPRLNEVSRICVSDIPEEIIREVERDVIGYKEW